MAVYIPDQLQDMAHQISQGQSALVSVRVLLGWFDAQRRGYSKVRRIRKALNKLKLRTEPDFEEAYLDASVVLVPKVKPSADDKSIAEGGEENGSPADAAPAAVDAIPVGTRVATDPSYRVGRLAAANRQPVSVSPDDTLQEAITVMLANDFSQLPVMVGEYNLKGLVSWKSIGSRLALGNACQVVRECVDSPHEVRADASLFDVIDLIAQHDCVLVRDSANRISGIVTASDLSVQFGQLGEPFLILGEIENHIRGLISGRFTKKELASARDPGDCDREIEDVADLALGECLRLLQDQNNWGKIGVKIDRKTFTKDLDEIRRIRNDVMHFDPDGAGEDDLTMLRKFVQFLQRLRQLSPKT